MNIASMAAGRGAGAWGLMGGRGWDSTHFKYLGCKAGLRLMMIRNPIGLVLTGALAFVGGRILLAGGRHGERRRWGDQQFRGVCSCCGILWQPCRRASA